jgi:PHD/YefM family antitoxin component YafN of YafNO toxin-antitoxin module
MPRKIREMQLKYITNEAGEKTAVILPIEEFEELLEDLYDLAVIAERRDEPTIPHEEVIAKLKRDGFLSD